MGNPTFDDLTRKMRSGRITRRHFIQSAAALGISATAISSALRANPSYAQEASAGHLLDDPHRAGPERLADDRRRLQRGEHRRPGRAGPDGRRRDRHDQADDGRPRRRRPRRLHARPLHRRPARRGGRAPGSDASSSAARTCQRGLHSLRLGGGEIPGRALRPPVRHRRPRALLQQGHAAGSRRSIPPSSTSPTVRSPGTGWPRSPTSSTRPTPTATSAAWGSCPTSTRSWHYTYGFAFGGTFFDEAALPGDAGRRGRRRRPPVALRLRRGARPAEGQRLRRSLRGGRGPSPRSRTRSSPSASPSPSPATGSSSNMAKYAPDIDYGMTAHPGAGGRRRVGDLGRRLVDGHPAGRQEPRRRLAVHAVHRRRAGAAHLHHRDRAPADDQQPARGSRPLPGRAATSSSPSSSCRPRRTARRCRSGRGTGTS